jgi:hypothetical protein
MSSDFLPHVYGAYAVLAVVMTVFLARTLAHHGAVFLESVFTEDPRLAPAVNRLLVVGFYLVNLGWAAMILRAPPAATPTAAIETLAAKLGLLLLGLAAMHFANLLVFHWIRQRGRLAAAPPPLAPAMTLPPTGA